MGTAVRRATPRDAAELTRLREVMLEGTGGRAGDGSWKAVCIAAFEEALAAPDGPLQAFVVDAADRPATLAACCVGVIQPRLPGPQNRSGLAGYILSVATDARYRRRGHARAVVTATMDWFRGRGVARVELHASEHAEGLYRRLGFKEPAGLALTAWLGPP